MTRRRRLGTVVLVMALASCGGAAEDGAEKDAAEPAEAPELSAAPAGTTSEVAPEPQGLAYAERSDSLAVAVRDPDRLLILDPTTLRARLSVRLPGKVRHLQTGRAGTVLVPVEEANTLFEVDPTSGNTRTTGVGEYPHDAAAGANGVVVAEEFAGSASVLRDGRVVHTFSDLVQPGGVVVDGPTALVVDVGEYTLTSYDLTALERVERVPAGEGPTHIARIGEDRVAVTDTRGGQVLVYSVRPLEQVGSLVLEGSPYGIAADPTTDTLWVTLTARNELVGLDVSDDNPREIARIPTVRQPDTVAVAPGARTLWVTGRSDGVVQRITR